MASSLASPLSLWAKHGTWKKTLSSGSLVVNQHCEAWCQLPDARTKGAVKWYGFCTARRLHWMLTLRMADEELFSKPTRSLWLVRSVLGLILFSWMEMLCSLQAFLVIRHCRWPALLGAVAEPRLLVWTAKGSLRPLWMSETCSSCWGALLSRRLLIRMGCPGSLFFRLQILYSLILLGELRFGRPSSPEVLQASVNVPPDVEEAFSSKRMDLEIFFPPKLSRVNVYVCFGF